MDLHQLAISCNFGEFLNEALLDRLVCRIKSETQQQTLLLEKDLSFEQALKIAVGMEAADHSLKNLKGESVSVMAVGQVSQGPQPSAKC